MTRRTPDWKFRLLCKRCNSYRYTTMDPVFTGRRITGMLLRCDHCNIIATNLDETNEPNEWDTV
jgi:hypothetical protein